MTIAKIVVSAHILTGSLFDEAGYDVDKSAENLADLEGDIITSLLGEEYPEAEVHVDIGIFKDADVKNTIEVTAYTANDEVIAAASAAIQKRLLEFVSEGIADYSWAVKA